MEPFNFNELPEVVRLLFEKVEKIEQIVLSLKAPTDDDHRLLDVHEAAVFLKISVAALYTKVSRNEVPFSKPGKKLYFDQSELQQWVMSGKRKTKQDIRKELHCLNSRFSRK